MSTAGWKLLKYDGQFGVGWVDGDGPVENVYGWWNSIAEARKDYYDMLLALKYQVDLAIEVRDAPTMGKRPPYFSRGYEIKKPIPSPKRPVAYYKGKPIYRSEEQI